MANKRAKSELTKEEKQMTLGIIKLCEALAIESDEEQGDFEDLFFSYTKQAGLDRKIVRLMITELQDMGYIWERRDNETIYKNHNDIILKRKHIVTHTRKGL